LTKVDWSDINTRRQHLLGFAEEMGFDPMVEINWRGMGPKMRNTQVSMSP